MLKFSLSYQKAGMPYTTTIAANLILTGKYWNQLLKVFINVFLVPLQCSPGGHWLSWTTTVIFIGLRWTNYCHIECMFIFLCRVKIRTVLYSMIWFATELEINGTFNTTEQSYYEKFDIWQVCKAQKRTSASEKQLPGWFSRYLNA